MQDIGDAETRLRALVELEVTPFAQPFRDFTGSAATTKEQRDFARFANIKGGKLALNWNDRPIEDAQAARIAELENTVRKLTGRERILGDETILYAAPEMYDVLQHYFDLLEQANNGDAVAECKLFEDIVLIEQVLMKAKGEA